jgi:hypothetical protein
VNGESARLREGLTAAIAGPGRGRATADRLCAAAVALLPVDGAALSIPSGGAAFRSLGAGGAVTDEVDQLQFTLGEGPCADVVNSGAPVLAADLNGPDGQRWPAFADAAIRLDVRAVFAFPVTVAGFPAGVLWFCRHRPGPLVGPTLTGAFLAADLAVLPLLDMLGIDLPAAVDDETSDAWAELGSLMRSEVSQAAGVLIVQLGVPPAEALMRLRAYAYAIGGTASDVAYHILDHTLHLGDDATGHGPGRDG